MKLGKPALLALALSHTQTRWQARLKCSQKKHTQRHEQHRPLSCAQLSRRARGLMSGARRPSSKECFLSHLLPGELRHHCGHVGSHPLPSALSAVLEKRRHQAATVAECFDHSLTRMRSGKLATFHDCPLLHLPMRPHMHPGSHRAARHDRALLALPLAAVHARQQLLLERGMARSAGRLARAPRPRTAPGAAAATAAGNRRAPPWALRSPIQRTQVLPCLSMASGSSDQISCNCIISNSWVPYCCFGK